MIMELPKKKVLASRVNPRSVVLFGKEKSGKSTVLSGLDNCLIIDLERGTDFLDALKYDVISEAEKEGVLPIIMLKKLINKIKESNKALGHYTYNFIALDTVTALEEIVLPYANKLYKDTPCNWGSL